MTLFSLRNRLAIGAAAAALLLTSTASYADDGEAMRGQINQLQQQIQQMQQQLQSLQNRVNQAQAQAPAQPAPPPNAPKVTESATHRFGLSSADGENTIELTGRLHLDAGDYVHYAPGSKTNAQELSNGINARRARIGVTGKFMGDWNYALIYDFGGNSDSLNINNAFSNGNSKNNAPNKEFFQSNTALSGIENAFITYNGFYNHGQTFPVAFDFGYMDVPWTLDESTSSNDIMFMERSSSQVVATEFGGGDSRSAFGARSNNDRYFVGAYLTGPNSGALHTSGEYASSNGSFPAADPTKENMVQLAGLARASYQILQSDDYSLHIGGNIGYLFHPESTTNGGAISLTDRPELRVDPTSFLATGNIDASSGTVYGAEAAAAWQNAFLQAEYFHYSVDQTMGNPTLNFDGGYVEASYSIGGKRRYNPATGAYTGVVPENPLSFASGGWGAVELAARYSIVNLNDLTSNVAGMVGGKQTVYAVGVNYYPNLNMRFMLDLEHADIAIPSGPAVLAPVNGFAATINAVAARAQVQF